MGYRTLKIPPPQKKKRFNQQQKSLRDTHRKFQSVARLFPAGKKNEETGSNTKSKLDNGYQTLDNLGIQ